MNHDINALIQKITSYNKGVDFTLIEKAYAFAHTHHRHQKRASGEPYISHPLAVAHLLADLKLDLPSIVTGLLHDTVEDTSATLTNIKEQFGEEISYLVDGVTKLSKLGFQSRSQEQAENLRKLVLAMAKDIRVLIIKLMDRLHNMYTIRHLSSLEDRQRIALETLEIYAPLAERIGMSMVQEQLQNLAFSVLDPDGYETILARTAEFHEKGRDIIQSVIKDLENILKQGGLAASVYGREKKPYSIWRKMQRKNIDFDGLSDLFGVRVVVGSKADCYQALGLIHHAKVVIPGTFKDYISTPKPNHYQALHTKVLGPHGARLEIQIRTQTMQEVAERGVAAHWQYKQGIPKGDPKSYPWLQGLLDILEHTSGDEEFLEHTKLEMFQDQVFCFTPKGDIINLPRGATVIDFAYAVHSAVGNACKGARVNGTIVSIQAELQSGDLVNVIIDKDCYPSTDWEQYAITGKAKANIRRFLRSKKRAQLRVLGQSIYGQLTLPQQETYRKNEKKILKLLSLSRFDDLLVHLGEEKISLFELERAIQDPTNPETQRLIRKEGEEKTREFIKGDTRGAPLHYAPCCYPLPGDRISGVIIPEKGLMVHRATCEIFQNYDKETNDIRNIGWGETESTLFHSRFCMMMKDDTNNLGQAVTAILKAQGELTNVRILRHARGTFEVIVDLQLKDKAQLDRIFGSLRFFSGIHSIKRM